MVAGQSGAARGVAGVALRPAVPADREFCFQLHRAAMGEYITAVWGWDEQFQRDHERGAFAPGRWQIITAGGVDVGMIHVDYRPGESHLSRIEILPGYQGRGIGTALISTLIDEAQQRGQALVLEVLTVNRRAHALYLRLGLKEVARRGDLKIIMRSGCGPARP